MQGKGRKKNMKKLIAFMLAVLMVVTMTACSAAKTDGTYVVGICQIAPHDALDAATNGFKAALTEAFGDKITYAWR
jgi:putative ABC transport system substrate-binding protein